MGTPRERPNLNNRPTFDSRVDKNQFDLLSHLRAEIDSLSPDHQEFQEFRSAAVVVPLFHSSSGWELLFTVRSKQLSNHAGQVSFPGGKVDEGESLQEAAIRELDEEVGLKVHEILGPLHSHPSPAKFVVTPIVAFLEWPQPIQINPAEVTEVFSVPLQQLNAIEPRTETRTIQNTTRVIRYYDYQNHTIWGLTGNIVNDLLQMIA